MNFEKYLDNMKSVYEGLLSFLDKEQNEAVDFENLTKIFRDIKIRDDKHDLKLFFLLIVNICNNHHRYPYFFEKIDRILNYFKDDITKYYSNSDIFDIFKSNKRLLLFLVEEKIMKMDEHVVKQITTEKYIKNKYMQYFAPEIFPFSNEEFFPESIKSEDDFLFNLFSKNANGSIEEIEKELPANFYENRKKGENDSNICKLIQNDSIDKFITYVNQRNISPQSTINPSIYETNSFLLKKQDESDNNDGISLIEYAAFYGSIQIFKYLKISNAEMSTSLMLYSIHGQNADIIHLLEESHIEPEAQLGTDEEEQFHIKYLIESIKCNHNDIANYFLNHLPNGEEISIIAFIKSIKYYNFGLMQKEDMKGFLLYLIQYDYYSLIKSLFATRDFDINQKIIQN